MLSYREGEESENEMKCCLFARGINSVCCEIWTVNTKELLLLANEVSLDHLNSSRKLRVQTGLTFNNSTFCPHSVFMCFVWISEQTAIISLYSIN